MSSVTSNENLRDICWMLFGSIGGPIIIMAGLIFVLKNLAN